MNKPKKTALAALAVTAAVLLSACGAGADPQSSPAAAPAASAGPAQPTASSSTASPAPSPDPSQATAQVKAAAEKFIKVGLLIGYPDKDADQYYDRVRPLMTKSGFARQKKDLGRLDTEAAKQIFAQRIRVNTKPVSPVKVTAVTETKASARGTYRLLRQQQIGGRWKTLKTDDEKSTITMTLVNDNGTWLVDTAS
jgi:hypothetical protein